MRTAPGRDERSPHTNEAMNLLALLSLLTPTAATVASLGLSDPALQPKFVTVAPNALDPSFLYDVSAGSLEVSVGVGVANTGLLGTDGAPLETPIWGYGIDGDYTWPGRTFVVQKDEELQVTWHNRIPIDDGYLITGIDNGANGNFTGRSVVDTSYHWCYSLEGYEVFTIETHGTPIVPHLHGGHTEAASDGNPEVCLVAAVSCSIGSGRLISFSTSSRQSSPSKGPSGSTKCIATRMTRTPRVSGITTMLWVSLG